MTRPLLAICFFLTASATFLFSDTSPLFSQGKLEHEIAPNFVMFDSSKTYNFIHYSKNKIYLPENLKTFFQKLRNLEQQPQSSNKHVNIVHFGDSHIQADFITNQIRTRFQEQKKWGDASRGFFFPCRVITSSHDPYAIKQSKKGVWKGSRNIQTSKKDEWGLGGMVAHTNDNTASIDIQTRGEHPFDMIRLYYDTSRPDFYRVRIWDGLSYIAPYRIFADGYATFLLSRPTTKASIVMQQQVLSEAKFTLEGISVENNSKKGIIYHSAGVNSAKVTSFLRSPKTAKHIASLSPDLIVISLGTNDCFKMSFDKEKFEKDYDSLLQRIKSESPSACIVMTTPGDTYLPKYQYNKHTAKVVNALKSLAKKHHLAVWDLYEVMGGYGSMGKWAEEGIAAKDRVHFSHTGYRVQADLFFKALMKAYNK